MLIDYKRGQGSVILRVKIFDSSVTTGAGKTGLTSASSGLIISTIADNEATATAYTVAGSTIESITTLGTYAAPTATKCRFKELDATNHPGVYEIQLADARLSVASAKSLLVSISGATNAAQCDALVPLRDLDPYDATRAGLAALPNAAAEAAGGLYTRGAGAGQIAQSNNGQIDTNAARVGGTTQTAGDLAALIAAVDDFVDTEVAAIKAKTDLIPATPASSGDSMALTSAAVDAILDEVVEGSTTVRQLLRGFASVLVGKATGLGTTNPRYRDLGDTKDRVNATCDANGNRSSITLDLT